ncbi:unnamed protein product [Paramecium sonneborni]|uniref:Uncharacterized protein n=1 Tax=Paramecium sonneborni TaxID=65129 RepID=A0A8S1LR05_9CILI|nr:unnamed protein product [Paramecium sonneborni]
MSSVPYINNISIICIIIISPAIIYPKMSQNYSITKFRNPTFMKQFIRLIIFFPGIQAFIIHIICKIKQQIPKIQKQEIYMLTDGLANNTKAQSQEDEF